MSLTLPRANDSIPWYRTKTFYWIVVGGVAVVGIVALVKILRRPKRSLHPAESRLRRTNYQQFAQHLQNESQQKDALEALYEISRREKEHDAIRENGLLEPLLSLLSSRPTDPQILINLIRVVANLAINEENRPLMCTNETVSSLLAYVDASDERISEHSLRCLLNLSLTSVTEDIIREQQGLPKLFGIFQSDTSSSNILFQTARVLINLVHNETNRAELIRLGTVDRAIELLLVADQPVSLCVRLIVLLGFFSYDCDLDTYKKISGQAPFLIGFLQQQLQKVDDKAALEGVIATLQAITKIGRRKKKQEEGFEEAIRSFQDQFVERVRETGKTGIESIAAFLTCADQQRLQEATTNCLLTLAQKNANVRQHIQNDLPKVWNLLHVSIGDENI